MSDTRLFPSEAEFTAFYARALPASPSTLPLMAEFFNQWPGLKSLVQELDTWPGSREALTQLLQLACIAGMRIAFTARTE